MIKPKCKAALFLACALPLMMAQCKMPQQVLVSQQTNGQGTALLKINAQANSPFKQIARTALLTISAGDMQTMTPPLAVTDSSVEGKIVGIPAGNSRLFKVDVFDSAETKRYSGSALADVIGDSTVPVFISVYRIDGNAIINGTIFENGQPSQNIPVLDPGLTAYWSFDSTSGNTYYDITGHGFNAIATGTGLGCVPGVLGNALSCPNSGFEITVANSQDSFVFKTFTVETWYYANSIPTDGQLKILNFDYAALGVRNGWTLCIVEQGYADFTLSSIDGNTWVNAQSITALTPNKWYHIAGSYDGSSLRIYVNGVLESTVSYSGGVRAPGTNARLGCQRLMDGTVRWGATGKIDELKVYNYALSSSSILSHYNAIVLPQNNSLPLASWSFDSSAVNTYYDITGHGYNAMSTGTGLSLVAGIKGQALNFSGLSYEVAVQNSSENFNLNKFSIETWYYSNVDPAAGIINGSHIFNFQYIASGVRNGYALYIKTNGIADFGMASNDGSYYTDVFSQTIFKQNTWYHIVATYDSVNLKVYVNGVLEGSASHPGGYAAPHSNAHIGELTLMDGTISYQLNAKLDELKFFGYAMPADSVLAHYNALKLN
jgi:Concanavalin A-like lectin/glucanases superfamily